jgi:hypothetical protein
MILNQFGGFMSAKPVGSSKKSFHKPSIQKLGTVKEIAKSEVSAISNDPHCPPGHPTDP